MNDIDPKLTELLQAVERLLVDGGSVTNRNRLRQAFSAFPRESIKSPITRTWGFTPSVEKAIARAGELADAANDTHIRMQHLEYAMREVESG
jgi:hypothetical protein